MNVGWYLIGCTSVIAPFLDFLDVVASIVSRLRVGSWKVPEGDSPRPINLDGWVRTREHCPFCCLFGRKRNDTQFLNKEFDANMGASDREYSTVP